MYSDTFWSTVEVTAWSQDGDYAHYIDVHHRSGCRGATLSIEAYKALCKLLDEEMEKSFNE